MFFGQLKYLQWRLHISFLVTQFLIQLGSNSLLIISLEINFMNNLTLFVKMYVYSWFLA